MTVIKQALAVLIVAGVVLGAWRYLGDGASITDPAWFDNAAKNVQRMFDFSDDTANQVVDQTTKN